MTGTKPVQLPLKPTALRSDQRNTTTINNGTRNINRTALHTTGIKFRQNLQNYGRTISRTLHLLFRTIN